MNESEFINNIKSRYALNKVGDDCAVIFKDAGTDLLLTADMLIEDVDFRLEWTTPEFLGHKALAVSLSDIAAMGGEPRWSMLSIGIPESLWKTDFLDRFYAGWFLLADEYSVELVGGDVSRSPSGLVIDSVVGGEVTKGRAILRSKACVGDALCVSGKLGGASGGLKLLEAGARISDSTAETTIELLLRQLKPQPYLTLAKLLQSHSVVTSMIDLSDGLSSDLHHICRQSNVGARLYSHRLPIDTDLTPHFEPEDCHQMALNGGEDFALLFTVAHKNISVIESLGVTQIGEITGNKETIEIDDGRKTLSVLPNGYRHF